MVQRARLILNPIPWSRKAWRKLPEVVNILEEAGIRVDLAFTRIDRHLTESVERAVQEGYGLVIVGGGDSTVSEVAAGLVGTGATLGILPFGTFNNIAHSLGISMNQAEAARTIIKGKPRDIDVGVANETYFFEAAGIGLDASLFPIGEEIKGGHYEKVLQGATEFLRYPTAEFSLIVDGREAVVHSPLVVVANGPYYGAGFTVAPEADMSDGLLEVVNFECSRIELARQFAFSALNREYQEACVATFRIKEVTILSPLSLHAHADGKPIGSVPVTCRVIPRSLRVIVP